MKPVLKVLLLAALLTTVALLPALPELGAQNFRGGPICPYAMQVTHIQQQTQQTQYYQQMQQQQQQMMRQQMLYQQQMMQQQQRQQQIAVQQQHAQQQQVKMQTHVGVQQQQVVHANAAVNRVATNQVNVHIPLGVGHRGTAVPWIDTKTQHRQTEVAHLDSGVQRKSTAVHTVSTHVNHIDTAVSRSKTNVQQMNTHVQQMKTGVQQQNTTVARLQTGAKTVCTSKELTVVTINYNCMACHKQMHGVPQQGQPTLVARQNNLPQPVARMNVPPLPNLVARQLPSLPTVLGKPLPLQNMLAKLPALNLPVDPGAARLPNPVMRNPLLLPAPVVAQQMSPMPVLPAQALPQVVMLPQLPPLGMPVFQDNPYRPGLAMLVAKSGDLPTTSAAISMAVSKQPGEVGKTSEAARMQVDTREMLEQPVELLMPTTQTPGTLTSGRLNLGAEPVPDAGDNPSATPVGFQPLNDDDRARPPLPVLPRSVWLAPRVAEPTFADFDRGPPTFAGGSATQPLEPGATPVENVTQSLGQPSLDAPPPLTLPTSIRTPG